MRLWHQALIRRTGSAEPVASYSVRRIKHLGVFSTCECHRRTKCIWARHIATHSKALAGRAVHGLCTEAGDDSGLPIRIKTRGVPIHLYADPIGVEEDAIRQLVSIAESGLAEHFVSAMPDVHLGKGAAVGSVYASKTLVAPNGVGVDIGCGMAAVPVEKLFRDDLVRDASDGTDGFVKEAKAVQRLIKAKVPTGADSHLEALKGTAEAISAISKEHPPSPWLRKLLSANARVARQLGTLGGGNHFLEVLYDETGQVWLMLHSGSRWIGNHTADVYNRKAIDQMRRDGRSPPSGRSGLNDLNSLRIDSEEGQLYLQDMAWCQAYALANRRAMLGIMTQIVRDVLNRRTEDDRMINTHHNFCQERDHLDGTRLDADECERCTVRDAVTGAEVSEELWVTRKGATSARRGEAGLIPGSMGVGSFVVEGKGESLSWRSCSHGAGRRLSRTKAFELVSQADFEASMNGILCDRTEALRDEAPQAYKDLSQVMQDQKSLVSIKHRLHPLINVKGIEKGSRQKKKGEARRDRKS